MVPSLGLTQEAFSCWWGCRKHRRSQIALSDLGLQDREVLSDGQRWVEMGPSLNQALG